MKRVSLLFIVWTMQGLVAFVWLSSLPTDTEQGLIFGFSASRLALIGISSALTSISAALLWFSYRPGFCLAGRLHKPLYILSVITSLSAPTVIIVLFGLGETTGYIYKAYAGRLAPLAAWFALSALELALFLAVENRDRTAGQTETKLFLRYTLLVLIALATIAAFIATTKLGITRYNDGSWGLPTTPLLEWQIILALFVSLTFLTVETRWRWLQKDRYVCLLIYIFTCLLWLSQPINPGFFATPPRGPNFEIYPFSDALIYAQYAQSALIGNGFLWPDVPTRPLYIAFITWMQAIAGTDYARVILLQTLALAAFPPVLYLLGKELAGGPLGLGLALLTACRDLTANAAAPFALNYTYTKLFFSEIPTALLISLFTLLVIRWMRQPKPLWVPLLAGGLLGLSALIRLQSAVVLAAAIPIGFFVVSNRKKWLTGSALMILGLALALTPWLARNYRATGGLVFDNPISQTMVLARRWSGDNGNSLFPYLPGEGDAQYSSRMTALALASLRADPGRILGSAVNHFFNNEIGNLLVFPLRDRLNSPAELLWPEHAFWQTWTGQPTSGQIPVIAFYVFLFGAGLAAAIQKNGLSGLLPLALSLVYNAWTALFLSSGDRFLVPVDWAIILYLFLGLLTLSSLVLRGNISPGESLGAKDRTGRQNSAPILWRQIGLTAIFILLCGMSVPLTESVFPKKYSAINLPAMSLSENGTSVAVTIHGRAVYPRWYERNEGEPGSAKLGYGKTDQARLVFFLVGEKNTLVIFPISDMPGFFPNTSDVTITGTLEEGYLRAQTIVVRKDGRTVEYHP